MTLKSPYGANAWIDLHVFDDREELIHATTQGLSYGGVGAVTHDLSYSSHAGQPTIFGVQGHTVTAFAL
jgi:hypothetical protein